MDRLSTRLSVRSIDGCQEKATQVDCFAPSDIDQVRFAGANEVVDKGLHHWIGCPLGRLQHADVKVRREKCDRLCVVVPQLIDDQRLIRCLIVGSKGQDQVLNDSLEHACKRFGVVTNTIRRWDASKSARDLPTAFRPNLMRCLLPPTVVDSVLGALRSATIANWPGSANSNAMGSRCE